MRLSLCMIVRNEERMLPGALESVRGLVDEMIVVDTGSTDRTVEIAESFGAKVVRFPWVGDFAAARNVSLEHATGDWILVLDADNRMPAGTAAHIRTMIAKADALGADACAAYAHESSSADATPEQVIAGRTRIGEPAMVVSFLRRAPDIRYTGIVHESAVDSVDARGGRKAILDVHLAHYGYLDTVTSQTAKHARNLTLLQRRVAAAPNNLTAIERLAHEHLLAHEYAEAIAVVDDAWPYLTQLVGGRHDRIRLAIARAIIQRTACDWIGLLDTVDTIDVIEPRHPDFPFLRGLAHEATGNLVGAERGYRAALELRHEPVSQLYVHGSRTWAAAARLGHVLLDLGRPADALASFDDALSFDSVPAGVRAARALCAASLDLAA